MKDVIQEIMLVAKIGQQTIFEIDAHPFLCFKASSPTKAYFKDKTGKIYGIELTDSSQIDMQELAKKGLTYDPYRLVETCFNQAPETIYFYSIMKNRLDSRVKRGAIVKALAIGTKHKVLLEPLTRYLVAVLDLIFDV